MVDAFLLNIPGDNTYDSWLNNTNDPFVQELCDTACYVKTEDAEKPAFPSPPESCLPAFYEPTWPRLGYSDAATEARAIETNIIGAPDFPVYHDFGFPTHDEPPNGNVYHGSIVAGSAPATSINDNHHVQPDGTVPHEIVAYRPEEVQHPPPRYVQGTPITVAEPSFDATASMWQPAQLFAAPERPDVAPLISQSWREKEWVPISPSAPISDRRPYFHDGYWWWQPDSGSPRRGVCRRAPKKKDRVILEFTCSGGKVKKYYRCELCYEERHTTEWVFHKNYVHQHIPRHHKEHCEFCLHCKQYIYKEICGIHVKTCSSRVVKHRDIDKRRVNYAAKNKGPRLLVCATEGLCPPAVTH